MKFFRIFAFVSTMATAGVAQDELSITIDDMLRDPKLCPAEIVLKKRTQVAVGIASAVYEVGSRLPVARVERELVYVRLGQNYGAIPIADTNLLEAANASFSVTRLRQRLIDEANALPEPPDEPALASTPSPSQPPSIADNPVSPMGPLNVSDSEFISDEFVDIGSLSRWKRLTETEGWNIDTMESQSVQGGFLTLLPYSQSWYKDYRGELFYQLIDGDFEMEALIGALNRSGNGLPATPYSLVGLMLRLDRQVKPETWKPGGEQYLFFGIGVGDDPGRPVYEYKLTADGQTNNRMVDAEGFVATLKMTRVGNRCFLLAKPHGGGKWRLLQSIELITKGAVQVGFTAQTDWPTVERTPVEIHNSTVLKEGNPDLRAVFDYVRVRRPFVPSAMANRDLTDEEALGLFGK